MSEAAAEIATRKNTSLSIVYAFGILSCWSKLWYSIIARLAHCALIFIAKSIFIMRESEWKMFNAGYVVRGWKRRTIAFDGFGPIHEPAFDSSVYDMY